MLTVPLDLWEFYLQRYLEPHNLSRVSGVCKMFHTSFATLIHTDYRSQDPNDALYRACLEGHRELAEWLIVKKGATNFYWALHCACLEGHRDLAEWLIDVKGATAFNGALYGACQGGRRELAEWLIDVKGATNLDGALRGACFGGHSDLEVWLRAKIKEWKNKC
jgi:hypothetical protein